MAIPAGTGILRNIPSQHCNPVSQDSSSLRRRLSETGLDSLFTKCEIWGHPGRQIKASKESGSRSRARAPWLHTERCLPPGASKVSLLYLQTLPRSPPRTLTCHLTRLPVMGRLVWVTPVHGGITREREARTSECQD